MIGDLKKNFFKFLSVGLVVLSLVLVLTPVVSHAQTSTTGQIIGAANPIAGLLYDLVPNTVQDISLGAIVKIVTIPLQVILTLVAALLGLAGLFLDYVIKLSVVDLAKNIAGITGINIAWTLIRDLVNMSFIFILVYHAIMMIFGKSDARKIIAPIIIAAILINFSLFFTKLIIDASNVVTVSFYNSVTAAGTNAVTVAGKQLDLGFAGAFMKPLNLTSIYDTNNIGTALGNVGANPGPFVVTLIGGSIFMLAAAFVFLSIGVMFGIRYLSFIFLLIISPLGYMSSVVPGLKGISSKYWDTLLGQAYFAPIFMIMSWITLTLVGSGGFLSASGTGSLGQALSDPSISSVGLIVNFCLLIGMMIYSLIISKSFATKGGIVTNKMIDKGTGFIGGLAFGSVARFGQQTFGRAGNALSENEKLKERASKGGVGGFAARQVLKTSNKAATSTFDARGASSVGSLAKLAGVDVGKVTKIDKKDATFRTTLDAKAKSAEETAKLFKPSDKAAEDAKAKLKTEEFSEARENERKREFVNKTTNEIDAESKERTIAVQKLQQTDPQLYALLIEKENPATSAARKAEIKTQLDNQLKFDVSLQNKLKEVTDIEKKIESKRKDIQDTQAKGWMSEEKKKLVAMSGGQEANKKEGKIEVPSQYAQRAGAYASTIENQGFMKRYAKNAFKLSLPLVVPVTPTTKADNRVIARKVRAVAKAKKPKEEFEELLKKAGIEKEEEEKEETPTPPPAGGTPPTP